jgi:tetratricopeptide (TPR) repeat protein
VKNWFTRVVSPSYAAALLMLPLPLYAGEIQVLRGRLITESQEPVQGLFVGMEEVASHTEIPRIDVALDGSFEFRRVPAGEYVVKVTDANRQIVHQQYVTILEHVPEFSIRLPEVRQPSTRPGTVSFRQLSHPPDKKAVNAFHAATRFSTSGKYDEAIAELQKAIRISPEFAGAYTNLAVQQIRLNRFAESAASSQRAIELGGPDPINLCNLAFAQFQLRRFQESAGNAAAALRLDPNYYQGHLILGSVLANVPERRAEAIAHLERAAEKFPSALVTLEKLHHMK